MATAKDCHTLTSHYEKKYKEKYGESPGPQNVNRVKARWNFDSILQGVRMAEVKELIDYYFTTPPSRMHDLDWFFYNYDKLAKGMREGREDAEHRQKLMEESKLRAERWRQSGKQGITNS